jgi:bifunctional UDP-N-acetylglucosamine pyrophosphorylase/glucosamine-1-phosphate N-acetyltransferase
MSSTNTQAVVLAAGRSTRFKRKESKMLSKICGQPMIIFPLNVLEELEIPTTVVLGYQAEKLRKTIDSFKIKDVTYDLQEDQLGTGHAVVASHKRWVKDNILIMNGDVPLLQPNLIKNLLKTHKQTCAAISFVATHVLSQKGYGRVIESNGKVRICEDKDCPEKYREIKKINAGIYLVKRSFLSKYIKKLKNDNKAREIYLTDLVGIASENNLKVNVVLAPFDEVRGVNTLQELWAVEQVSRSTLIKHWMDRGVRFELAQSIHIDLEVEIGADSFVGTGAHIIGNTKIGEGCVISAFSIIENSTIGDGTVIYSHSVIQDSVVEKEVSIGPFARLRNNSKICENSCVGNFVEIKNSVVGPGSKAKHLSYLGDATIGKKVNIGAGTIVCNYDGSKKHRTVIEDEAFIGSNDTLVAPLTIGKGSYIAAGSTITKNVPPKDLAIARARQENKKKYVEKLKTKTSHQDSEVKYHFLGATKTGNSSEEKL